MGLRNNAAVISAVKDAPRGSGARYGTRSGGRREHADINSPMLLKRTLSPTQCQVARALLGWPQVKLAASAQITPNGLVHFEANGQREPIEMILFRRAIEPAAIEFSELTDGVSGVLRRSSLCVPGNPDAHKTN